MADNSIPTIWSSDLFDHRQAEAYTAAFFGISVETLRAVGAHPADDGCLGDHARDERTATNGNDPTPPWPDLQRGNTIRLLGAIPRRSY